MYKDFLFSKSFFPLNSYSLDSSCINRYEVISPVFVCLFVFWVFFSVLGLALHQIYFCEGFFKIGSHKTICSGWLGTTILLIFGSWVVWATSIQLFMVLIYIFLWLMVVSTILYICFSSVCNHLLSLCYWAVWISCILDINQFHIIIRDARTAFAEKHSPLTWAHN
jgi:hypothetical protein